MYIINGMTTKHSRFEIIMKEMSKKHNPAQPRCGSTAGSAKRKRPGDLSNMWSPKWGCCLQTAFMTERMFKLRSTEHSQSQRMVCWNWRDPGLRLLPWVMEFLWPSFCCLLFLGSRSRILVVERPNFGGQTKIWATLKIKHLICWQPGKKQKEYAKRPWRCISFLILVSMYNK